MAIYENSRHGVKIPYPRTWTIREGTLGTVVLFLSPREDSSDNFQENLNLIVQDLSGQKIGLKEFTEISKKQIQKFISNPDIILAKEITLAENPGYEVMYSGKQGNYNLKWKQAWTVLNEKAYVLTYTSQIQHYEDYLKYINAMQSGFEIE
jgi:serine/threonine-protein kinase